MMVRVEAFGVRGVKVHTAYYDTDSQVDALVWFRHDYPDYDDTICVAETVREED